MSIIAFVMGTQGGTRVMKLVPGYWDLREAVGYCGPGSEDMGTMSDIGETT